MEFQHQLCLIETQDSSEIFGKACIKLWVLILALVQPSTHKQMVGFSERIIRTLEDMLRACVLDFKGS